jgi:hypothetical protein
MAVSTQASVLAWRRVSNYLQGIAVKGGPAARFAFEALKEYLTQQGGNPDLQFVPFDELSDTDVVLIESGGAGKLFGICLVKDTTTATFSKFTDHASTASDAASELRLKQAEIGVEVALFPQGLALASGLVAQGTTTADGGTGSASNGAKGFVLIGDA